MKSKRVASIVTGVEPPGCHCIVYESFVTFVVDGVAEAGEIAIRADAATAATATMAVEMRAKTDFTWGPLGIVVRGCHADGAFGSPECRPAARKYPPIGALSARSIVDEKFRFLDREFEKIQKLSGFRFKVRLKHLDLIPQGGIMRM